MCVFMCTLCSEMKNHAYSNTIIMHIHMLSLHVKDSSTIIAEEILVLDVVSDTMCVLNSVWTQVIS